MKKNYIIIADRDSEFYYPLMLCLLDKFSDEELEIQIITRLSVLQQKMIKGKRPDILVISELFYQKLDKLGNVEHVIVLSEQYDNGEKKNEKVTTVFRYVKLQTLEHVIQAHMRGTERHNSEKRLNTSLILVTSVTGGTGKTVTAFALVQQLKKKGKSVLYIDAEWIQDFNNYIMGTEVMSHEVQKSIIFSDGNDCKTILSEVKKKGDITYIPQMDVPIVTMNKSLQIYLNLIQNIVNEGSFEYVIVDTDHCLDLYKMKLLKICDDVIMVMDSSPQSVHKFSKLTRNINIMNKCKLICNNQGREYDSVSVDFSWEVELPLISGNIQNIIRGIGDINSFQEMVYMLL